MSNLISKLKATFDEVSDIGKGIYACKMGEMYKLFNDKGQQVSKREYTIIGKISNNSLKVSLTWNKTGVIDINGNDVIPPIYSDIGRGHGGDWIVYKDYYGLLDNIGHKKLDLKYKKIEVISHNCYHIQNKDSAKHGTTNVHGNIIIPLIYNEIKSYENGILACYTCYNGNK